MATPVPVPPPYHSADAGQFWLVKPIDKEPAWPVYICPEEIVEEYFKKAKSRPANARRADGTFSKAYGKSQQLLPVLYLGNLRMRWAKRIQLSPLDPQIATRALDTDPNSTSAHAYTEYLEQYGSNDIHYWSSRLLVKRLSEDDSGDDEEEEEAALSQPQPQVLAPASASTSAPIPKPARTAGSNQLLRPHRDDESDEENLRSLVPESKRVKLESAGSVPLTSIPNHASRHTSRHASLQAGQSNHQISSKPTAAALSTKVKVEDIDKSKVKIYVDNPHVIYTIKSNRLNETSPVLASQIHSSKDGLYIMTPWLSAISATDFRPIAEFIESGEYHPYIIDAGTDSAHLAGLCNIQDQKIEVLKCGVVHTIAHQFDMPKLQALVISKLKTLQPYPAEELIAMTELAFGSGLGKEDGLDELVVNYIVDKYFELSMAATARFNQLLSANDTLKNQVFAKLAGTHGENTTVKKEEEEGKAEAATGDGGSIDEINEIVDDENTPPSAFAGVMESQAEAASSEDIHVYEDVEINKNTPPLGNGGRVPLSERKDLPLESDGSGSKVG
ncbi:MAG: hypothetical protein Q9209_005800 [Squamulea sp. 1 TL-2023]